MRSRGEHEKEYVVTVDKEVTDKFLKAMSKGVPIVMADGEVRVTKKCDVAKVDDHTFRIILRQGLNRQIRRMCESFDMDVKRLVRIRVMNVELGDLPSGKYRDLTDAERKELLEKLGL
jgi:23S rRNA pseudouridine2604 synthase